MTGPVPSSAFSAVSARLAWSRHAFWRSSSRASRARVLGRDRRRRARAGRDRRSRRRRTAARRRRRAATARRRLANRSPGMVPVAPPSDRDRAAPARGRSRHGSGASRRTRRAGSPGRHPRAASAARDSRRRGTPPSPRQPGSVRHGEPDPTRPGEPLRRRAARAATAAAGDCERWTPSSSRQRSSGATGSPRSIASTVSATSRVDGDPLAVLDLDDHVERRRRLALEDALLGAPAARLLVAEGHALDAADEVGQGRVEHQVVEVVAVGGADQLDAALGDRAGGLRPRAPSRSRR